MQSHPHSQHHQQSSNAIPEATPDVRPAKESAPAPATEAPAIAPATEAPAIVSPATAAAVVAPSDAPAAVVSGGEQKLEEGVEGGDEKGWSRGAQPSAALDLSSEAPTTGVAPSSPTPTSSWKRGSTMAEKTAAHMLARDDGIVR